MTAQERKQIVTAIVITQLGIRRRANQKHRERALRWAQTTRQKQEQREYWLENWLLEEVLSGTSQIVFEEGVMTVRKTALLNARKMAKASRKR